MAAGNLDNRARYIYFLHALTLLLLLRLLLIANGTDQCFFLQQYNIKKLITKFFVSDEVFSQGLLLISIIILFCSDSKETLEIV